MDLASKVHDKGIFNWFEQKENLQCGTKMYNNVAFFLWSTQKQGKPGIGLERMSSGEWILMYR